MPSRDKSDHPDKQKRRAAASEEGREQKGMGRPEAEARARAPVNKPHGGGMKIGVGRKVPFGPVGGSGRKTNLSRSS